MNTNDIGTALAAITQTFEPSRRTRFKNLLPHKEALEALRNRGASFETISRILKKHSLKASHELVRGFVREVVEQKQWKRRRRRRNTAIKKPVKKSKIAMPSRTWKIGEPRIARIEDL